MRIFCAHFLCAVFSGSTLLINVDGVETSGAKNADRWAFVIESTHYKEV